MGSEAQTSISLIHIVFLSLKNFYSNCIHGFHNRGYHRCLSLNHEVIALNVPFILSLFIPLGSHIGDIYII